MEPTCGGPLSDLDGLALTLWAEARGESVEGRIAVASVIRNRLKAGRWGKTYLAVCQAPFQFSCWNANATDANHRALLAVVDQIQRGGKPVDAVLEECYWIAAGCMSGQMRDRVKGATHYYAKALTVPPDWARHEMPVDTVGGHLFFAGIA